METKVVAVRTWDDLVFINRNQAYGAYSLRKEYSRRVIIGWGVSMAIVAMLIIFPQFLSKPIRDIVPELPKVGKIRLTEYIAPVQPPQTQRTIPQRSTHVENRSVQIVHAQVVETPPAEELVEEPLNGSEFGSELGNVEGVDTGTSDIPAVAVPTQEFLIGAEVMPTYKGGMEALMRFVSRNIKYPGSARRLGIEGTVFISFVVHGDGAVSHVTVLRGIYPQCDEEAMRVIAMLPDWIGGKQAGIPVNVKMVLPIKFSLQNL